MSKRTKSPAHTAEPWRIDSLGDDRIWILDDQSNYIAEIVTKDECGFVCPKAQRRANARLIAAAPELLHALRDMSEALADFYGIDHIAAGQHFGIALQERLERAIAKTKGR